MMMLWLAMLFEVLFADAGNDEIRGLRKNDRLHGGIGEDCLFGGPGADYLYGGSGHDVLRGGSGHDESRSGSGDDRMRGGYGSDLFVLGSGFDVIEDFRISDNDKIGIRDSMNYYLQQEGDELVISTTSGETFLFGVNLSFFDESILIVDT